MSINAYDSKQEVRFGATPSTYYGWHVTTGGDIGMSVHPFSTLAERQRFAEAVRRVLPDATEYDADIAAAAAALWEWGNSEEDRGDGEQLLHQHLGDAALVDRVYELALDWELNSEPQARAPEATERTLERVREFTRRALATAPNAVVNHLVATDASLGLAEVAARVVEERARPETPSGGVRAVAEAMAIKDKGRSR
jgi:hypothetical protein